MDAPQNPLHFEALNPNSMWNNNQDKEKNDEVEHSGKSESNSNGSADSEIGALQPDAAEKINSKSLEEYVSEWAQRKIDAGIPESRCYLPFLEDGPKMVILFINTKIFGIHLCWF